MRRFLAVWLIALFSLTNLAAVDSCHSPEGTPGRCEGAFAVTEESLSQCQGFFASLRMTYNEQIPFEGYWELVRNTRQALVRLEASPNSEIRRGLDDLAAKWEQVTAVEFPDQSVVTVDPSYLVAILKQDTSDIKRLVSLMDVLLKAHEDFPQKVFTVQDVESLKEILARPEFQWTQAQAPQNPEWLQRILDAINKFMDRLAYSVQNGVYYGRVPLIIAAALVFIISLFFIARNLSRNLVREVELAAENSDDDALLTSKGAMQRAQTLSGQGDYRNAVRYLYLSSLLILDENGVLRYDRSRTNREYLRSVSSKPELAKPLNDVIDVFDRVWYGFDSVDDETYQSYVKHVDELREKKE
jgi:uncharacterized protein DUF4129